MLFCSYSQFPQFWAELDDDQNDLVEVKSILTVLGYVSKTSVSSIKTQKVINRLECEYAKMRSNKPTEMFSRFPALQHVDFFAPGLKTIILDLATRFSPKPKADDVEKIIKSSVLRQGKKVSNV